MGWIKEKWEAIVIFIGAIFLFLFNRRGRKIADLKAERIILKHKSKIDNINKKLKKHGSKFLDLDNKRLEAKKTYEEFLKNNPNIDNQLK
jgi:hypothetical protein